MYTGTLKGILKILIKAEGEPADSMEVVKAHISNAKDMLEEFIKEVEAEIGPEKPPGYKCGGIGGPPVIPKDPTLDTGASNAKKEILG